MAPGDPTPGHGEGAILYAVFLSIRPGKALTSTVIDQHAVHLAELDRQGRLVLAGPLLARFSGLIVLRVSSLAEARAIAEADPMIRGGFQSYGHIEAMASAVAEGAREAGAQVDIKRVAEDGPDAV